MKKTFIVLVVAFVLSVASSAWGIYISELYNWSGKVGEAYDGFCLSARNTDSKTKFVFVNWSISGGQLPPGLYLSPSLTGSMLDIKGTPRQAGVYNFSITADDLSNIATSSFTITIEEDFNFDTEDNSGGGEAPGNNTGGNDNGNTGNNNENNGKTIGHSGGGCDSSLGFVGLIVIGAGLIRKNK